MVKSISPKQSVFLRMIAKQNEIDLFDLAQYDLRPIRALIMRGLIDLTPNETARITSEGWEMLGRYRAKAQPVARNQKAGYERLSPSVPKKAVLRRRSA